MAITFAPFELEASNLASNLPETTNAATSGPNPMDPGQDTNEEGLAANRSVNAHANNLYVAIYGMYYVEYVMVNQGKKVLYDITMIFWAFL